MTQEQKLQIDRDYRDIEHMIEDLYSMAKNKGASYENKIKTILLLRLKVFEQKRLVL